MEVNTNEMYTLTRALSKIKTLTKQIGDIKEIKGLCSCKKKGTNELSNGMAVDDFSKRAISKYDSYMGLIETRRTLNTKLAEANAKTEVFVPALNCKMTIVEILKRKDEIEELEMFINTVLKPSLMRARDEIDTRNNDAEKAAHSARLAILGERTHDSGEDIVKLADETYQTVYNRGAYEIVDPLGIEEKINSLESYVQLVKHEFDYLLTSVNSTTYID